jgi:hypothetical protein
MKCIVNRKIDTLFSIEIIKNEYDADLTKRLYHLDICEGLYAA